MSLKLTSGQKKKLRRPEEKRKSKSESIINLELNGSKLEVRLISKEGQFLKPNNIQVMLKRKNKKMIKRSRFITKGKEKGKGNKDKDKVKGDDIDKGKKPSPSKPIRVPPSFRIRSRNIKLDKHTSALHWFTFTIPKNRIITNGIWNTKVSVNIKGQHLKLSKRVRILEKEFISWVTK